MLSDCEIFWKEIQNIQRETVDIFLSKITKYDDMENLLQDVSYEVIYGMLELLDGLKNDEIKGNIITVSNGNVINSHMDLHNYCEDYLKCSKV